MNRKLKKRVVDVGKTIEAYRCSCSCHCGVCSCGGPQVPVNTDYNYNATNSTKGITNVGV